MVAENKKEKFFLSPFVNNYFQFLMQAKFKRIFEINKLEKFTHLFLYALASSTKIKNDDILDFWIKKTFKLLKLFFVWKKYQILQKIWIEYI